MAGAAVDAEATHIREIENYNRALNLARDAALRPDVFVGIFSGPSPRLVQSLMDELVTWLRRPSRTPPLVRSALLHLNMIAIHPFNDGNGRTARIPRRNEAGRLAFRQPRAAGRRL